MADTQETIADIIAEMRIFKCRNLETGELELCNAIANYLADRLEAARERELQDALDCGGIVAAAHEREMSKAASKNGADFGQLGDCAKLREVVERVVNALSGKMADAPAAMTSHEVAILKQCRAALAAPATAEKSSAVGDCAKLREALVRCRNCAQMIPQFVRASKPERSLLNAAADYANLILRDVAEGLAAPARNCDVYNADELKAKFNSELASELPMANKHQKNLVAITAMAVIDTLLAPATEQEGGKDAD